MPGDLDTLNLNVEWGEVYASAQQPDGRMVIAGTFIKVLGQPRGYIARINADGTLDTGFDPQVDGFVHSLVVQVDGKILLGGEFTSVQPKWGGGCNGAQSYC
ncbi:MAG: delta-60 repeat domain-containing protein [Verrucomicrobiales bacterium]|nr:delta-60 repeat domain-containing protein [Verrucomicrobiales bacterium]